MTVLELLDAAVEAWIRWNQVPRERDRCCAYVAADRALAAAVGLDQHAMKRDATALVRAGCFPREALAQVCGIDTTTAVAA